MHRCISCNYKSEDLQDKAMCPACGYYIFEKIEENKMEILCSSRNRKQIEKIKSRLEGIRIDGKFLGFTLLPHLDNTGLFWELASYQKGY